MKFEPRYSRLIDHFDYDGVFRSLRVQYKDGRLERCADVPPELFAGLRATLTPDEFFAAYIKPQSECEQIHAAFPAARPRSLS